MTPDSEKHLIGMVDSIWTVLRGRPDDRKDQGLIGQVSETRDTVARLEQRLTRFFGRVWFVLAPMVTAGTFYFAYRMWVVVMGVPPA